MLRNLLRWAKITKPGTNGQQFATQQVTYLGKVGDGAMLFPYGYHANVPPDTLTLVASVQDNPDSRVALGCLLKERPELKDGETGIYHPPTGAFIIFRKSGDLDIESGEKGTASININCKQANVVAAESVNIDSPNTNLGVAGQPIARVGDSVQVEVTTGSSMGTYTGVITSGGDNTSI